MAEASAKYVCERCINDDALAAVLRKHAVASECTYCGQGKPGVLVGPLESVIRHMWDCINREYGDPASGTLYDIESGEYDGETLDAWSLFERIGFEPGSIELRADLLNQFSEHQWGDRNAVRGEPFNPLAHGWRWFKGIVKYRRRFTFWSMEETEWHRDDLEIPPVGSMLCKIGEAVGEAGLVRLVPQGTPIWRARCANGQIAEARELCPPPREKAQASRMSPAGIVMFYGADDCDTACLETIDPRMSGPIVTAAAWETKRELLIFNLVDLPKLPSFFDETQWKMRRSLSFLREFSEDMARPIARDGRQHIEYVPTQAFTEYIRFELPQNGAPVDGIRYPSSRTGRGCYVLFCGADECVGSKYRWKKQVEKWLESDPQSIKSTRWRAQITLDQPWRNREVTPPPA